MGTTWEKYAVKAPAIKPLPTTLGAESTGYEFGKPLVREDPEWYNFGTDPLFWLLEKVSRPHSALLNYMDATLKGESSWDAVKDSFATGQRPQVYEILDNMGLKGQAGHFDPVADTIGFAMEVLLDPVNLIGVGAKAVGVAAKGASLAGKAGKVAKGVDVAADVASATKKMSSFEKTIEKMGGIDKLVQQGIVPPGDLGARVLATTEKMMGPKAFSHYINLGYGKYKMSVPFSNVVLEKALIGPAKAVRSKFKNILSTIPESHDEAILKAIMDTSERVISGAEKSIANSRRIVGPAWASKLSQAVEDKSADILKGAPDRVIDEYDNLIWFGKYAPQIEQLSGVMTKGLGEAAGSATTLAGKLEAHGLGDEAQQLGYMLHSVTKGTKDYLYKNDIRYAAKRPKGFQGPFRPKHLSQLPRELPGAISDINTRYGKGGPGKFTLHPRGELEGLYNTSPALRGAITDVARAFDSGLDKTSKTWPRVQAQLQKIGEGLGVGPGIAGKPAEMTEAAYKTLWNTYLDSGNGKQWAKSLFKDASHRQHFDQFMEDDALRLFGARVGRHYRARTIAETIGQMMDHPEWAVPIEKIPRELADDIATGIKGLGDDVEKLPDGFRLLDIGKIENNLTPEFANRIRNTAFRNDMAVALEKGVLGMFDVRDVEKNLGTLRQIMGYFRASTILPFAGYHVANKAGNMWWRMVGGTLDPRNDIDAGRFMLAMFKNDRKALEKMTFNLGKRKMTGIELRNAVEQYDVATGGFLTEAAGGGPIELGAEIGAKTKWHEWINPASRKQIGSKVARGIEDGDRIAHFIGRLRNGDVIDEASKSVDTYLFRYSDLTEYEAGTRAGMGGRDFMMFYTWYRKNLGLTLQKTWEYPGRLSMPIKVRHALDDVFGDPDSEYAVPSYMRDSFYLYLGKNKEGMPRFLDPEKYLPPISAAKFGAGGLKGMGQQLGSMLVPPLKAAFEFGSGTEFFSGRDLEGVPGQVKSAFGQDVNSMLFYAMKNVRILNTLNKILFPRAEGADGQRLATGQPGQRPPGATGEAVVRDWLGIRTTDTNPQLARHMEGVSKNGRIGDSLNKIESKMANPGISSKQRNSFMNERTKLLWEKSEILGEIIADGTDPFTGKSLKWVKDKSVQGEADQGSLRSYYTELQRTLRDLYFGNTKGPLDHGIITLDPQSRLSPEEAIQTYDMFRDVTADLLKRNTEWAIEKKSGDYYRYNVLDKVRALIKTEEYYSPQRIKRRKGKMPQGDIVIYNYPYDFRKVLADSYQDLLQHGVKNRLIKRASYSGMWKSFNRDYGVDYRE